ncbi:MAG: PQQ-binding-like beta-propeller repeat protein [Fibrobacterota bacterium]
MRHFFFACFILLFLAVLPARADYGPADSLLEEAAYQAEIAGEWKAAVECYEKALAGFSGDAWVQEAARKGLKLCYAVLGKPYEADAMRFSERDKSPGSAPLLLWRRAFGAGSVNCLCEAGERFALVTGDGTLAMAARADGRLLWIKSGVRGDLPPVYDNGRVYVMTDRGTWAAYSAAEGRAEAVSASAGLSAGLAVSGGLVLVPAGNRLAAFSAKNGALVWAREFRGGGMLEFAPCADNAVAVAAVPGKGLRALSLAHGDSLWSASIEPDFPLLQAGNAFIAVQGGLVLALSKADGRLLWRVTAPGPVTAVARMSDRLLAVLDDRGRVLVLNAATGVQTASFTARPAIGLAAHDSLVAVVDARGEVCLYGLDGKPRWTFATGETERCELAPLFSNLAVLTAGHGLFLLNAHYAGREDDRLQKGRLEIDMLLRSGMDNMALGKVRGLLLSLAPGDPALNRRLAELLQEKGESELALRAWAGYFRYMPDSGSSDRGLEGNLRALSGASWVSLAGSTVAFSQLFCRQGRVVLPGDAHLSLLYESNGAPEWRGRLEGLGPGLPAVVQEDGRFYATGEGAILCFDLAQRRTVWRVAFEPGITGLVAANGRLFAGTWEQGGFEIETGNGRIVGQVCGNEKALYPLTDGSSFYGVSLRGRILRCSGAGPGFAVDVGEPLLNSLVLSAGRIVVPTSRGFLRAFSAADGTPLWKARTGVQAVGLVADGTRIYAILSDGILAAYDLASGRRAWVKKSESGSAELLACAGGRVAFSEEDRVVLRQASTGEKTGLFRTAGRISALAFSGPDALFVRLDNGLVYRFDLE